MITEVGINRLKEFLDSECTLYKHSYSIECNQVDNYCIVEIKDHEAEDVKRLKFRFRDDDELELEFKEGVFYWVSERSYSVKYFWMLVSSLLPVYD